MASLNDQITGLGPFGEADSGTRVTSVISTNDVTGVVVKATAGLLYGIQAFNNSTTIAYLKLYNSATAPTTATTVVARYMIPGPASGGGGFINPIENGKIFNVGIAYRLTTGIADSDVGAPAANAYILNFEYK